MTDAAELVKLADGEKIMNAIIAGIGSNDTAIEQALQILENLKFAGFTIDRQRCAECDCRDGECTWIAPPPI